MKIREIMTKSVDVIDCNSSIKDCAALMERDDIGAIPVFENDKANLVGMITDRDICIRAVSRGSDPSTTKVKDIMTPHVHQVNPEDDLTEAAKLMADKQIRRVVVIEPQSKSYVGIVALADIARHRGDENLALKALKGVSCC